VIGQRNLAPERGPNVWEQGELDATAAARSRWRQGLGGAAIAVTGAALAAVGGSMIYRATRCARTGQAALDAASAPNREGLSGDVVADESAASFPASDAPSWTPTLGATTHKGAH
jgi:hypothetical protein